MSLSNIFNADTIRTWLMYRGLFLDTDWELAGWRNFPSTYVLDVVSNWFMFGVGGLLFGSGTRAQFLFGMYAMPFAWTCLSAYGWMKLCRLVWQGQRGRASVVVLAHALPFASFAMGQEYPFTVLFQQVFHTSTWVAMPWLLLLWLATLRGTTKWQGGWGRIGIATLALFIVTLHDSAIAAWFTVPTMLATALALLVARPRTKSALFWQRQLPVLSGKLWLPMIVATWTAMSLSDAWLKISVPVSFLSNPQVLPTLLSYLVEFWHHASIALVAWVLFVVVGLAHPLYRSVVWARGGRFIEEDGEEATRSRSKAIYRCLLPWWLAGTISGTVVTGIVLGLAYPIDIGVHWAAELRYYLPACWLPLFVGWALLPWQAPKGAVAGGCGVVVAACVAYVAASPPNLRHLDPFANDFHECYATHATDHGWVGGMGSHWYGWLLADPQVPLQRFMRSGTNADHGLLVSANNGHPAWGQGRFDFFVLSELEPTDTMYPPLDPQAQTCYGNRRERCLEGDRLLGEAVVRKLMDDGYEILDCDGVRIARFAEPRNFNISF